MTKRCGGCKQSKALIDFNKDRCAKGGLDFYCRSCNRIKLQKQRQKAKNYKKEPKAMLSYIRELLRAIVRENKVVIPLNKRLVLAKKLYKKLLAHPTCPYTGDVLIPRVNLSLDHIKPIAKGGTHTIRNLEWVSRRANQAKADLTPSEFYNLCKLILKNRHARLN